MSFTALTEYSRSSLPTCGTANAYHYCSNTTLYKPYDISTLVGEISSLFESSSDILNNDRKKIMSSVSTLANEWGNKFITIDGKNLGIVDEKKITSAGLQINSKLEEEKSKCNSLINEIITKTEEVIQYLKQLDNTYQEYLETKAKYERTVSNYNELASQYQTESQQPIPDERILNSLSYQMTNLNSQKNTLKKELDRYIDDKEPTGSWILG